MRDTHMKQLMKKACALLAGIVLLAGSGSIQPLHADEEKTVRILFTNDINDHIVSSDAEFTVTDAEGNTKRETRRVGGYTYLKSVIDAKKTASTVLVDAGNYSNGQCFDFMQAEFAPDLTMLGMLGYDAVTLGEREFLYGLQTLSYMIRGVDKKPGIVLANVTTDDSEAGQTYTALQNDGLIQNYTIVEKNGVKIGIFGIMDEAEGDRLRGKRSITVNDAEDAARKTVDALKKEGAEIIICLDHGADASSAIAEKVDDIDVLVCCNHYDMTEEPVKVGDTLVVSAGYNSWYLGVLDLRVSDHEMVGYELAPVNKTDNYSASIDAKATGFLHMMNQNFLKKSGYSNSSSVAVNSIEFDDIRENYTEFGNNNMADLVTDSYVRALHYVTDNYSFAIGITDKATVGDALPRGSVTVRDIVEAVGYNSGYDGGPGASLLGLYMTGKDLRMLCEYDASIARDNYPEEHLFFSGLKYTYSDKRPYLNKVIDVYVEEAQGYWVPVTNSKYYHVVLNREITERKTKMKERSDGWLDINFYHSNHILMTQFETAVLQVDKREFKAWRGMCMELEEASRNEKGQPVVSAAYAEARPCRMEITDPDFWSLIKNPSAHEINKYKNWAIGLIAAYAAWKTVKALWSRYKTRKAA